MVLKHPSGYDDEFINIIKEMIDHIKVHGKTIQDLVAEGQLTEEQYTELITTINGHLKSGEVDFLDFNDSTKNKILGIDQRIVDLINALDGSEELYTPVELGEFLTVQNESWVI